MRFAAFAAIAALTLAPLPAAAQNAPSPEKKPDLIVVISVDQFSANLFSEYRNHFTGGFKRLLDGAVHDAFPVTSLDVGAACGRALARGAM